MTKLAPTALLAANLLSLLVLFQLLPHLTVAPQQWEYKI